jgi:hypothetical protein
VVSHVFKLRQNPPRRLSFNRSTHNGRSCARAISGGVPARRQHRRQQNVWTRLPNIVRDARRAVNPTVSCSSQFRKTATFQATRHAILGPTRTLPGGRSALSWPTPAAPRNTVKNVTMSPPAATRGLAWPEVGANDRQPGQAQGPADLPATAALRRRKARSADRALRKGQAGRE